LGISQSRHAVVLYLEMENAGVHRQGVENRIADLWPHAANLAVLLSRLFAV
jgi:hypothetical protein